jgi:hypothetical protein
MTSGNAYQLQPTEADKEFYWAVPCNHCGFILALALVRLDEQGVANLSIKQEPFEAHCPVCRSDGSYLKAQVVLWRGPQPAPDFLPNRALQ